MESLVPKHPLQRLQSPSRTASALLHIIGIASFANSFKYLNDNPNEINSAYGWHFQYLTIIGLTLALFTFTSGLVADLTLARVPFRAKNTLSILSTPLALLIAILYWTLRAIDPTLVVPPEFELPLAADIGFHAVPCVLLLLDLLLFSPPWTITVVPALGVSLGIAMAYWYWLDLCFSRNGFYPYPLLELLDFNGRVALFGGSAVVMCVGTVALRWVYGVVNGVETRVDVSRGEVGGVRKR